MRILDPSIRESEFLHRRRCEVWWRWTSWRYGAGQRWKHGLESGPAVSRSLISEGNDAKRRMDFAQEMHKPGIGGSGGAGGGGLKGTLDGGATPTEAVDGILCSAADGTVDGSGWALRGSRVTSAVVDFSFSFSLHLTWR